jgi:hypothetical protein
LLHFGLPGERSGTWQRRTESISRAVPPKSRSWLPHLTTRRLPKRTYLEQASVGERAPVLDPAIPVG